MTAKRKKKTKNKFPIFLTSFSTTLLTILALIWLFKPIPCFPHLLQSLIMIQHDGYAFAGLAKKDDGSSILLYLSTDGRLLIINTANGDTGCITEQAHDFTPPY